MHRQGEGQSVNELVVRLALKFLMLAAARCLDVRKVA